MTIHKLVIHNLIKESGIQKSEYKTADVLLQPDAETSNKLVLELCKLYGKKDNSAIYGSFSRENESNKFPSTVDEYMSTKDVFTDESFMAMTKRAMIELNREAKAEQSSTGGHIIFVHHEEFGTHYIMIAMIKKSSGLNIDENLKIESITEIDLSKIHQAAQINISLLKIAKPIEERNKIKTEEDDNETYKAYLSFVSPKSNKNVSGYFIRALDCTDSVTPVKATTASFNCLKGFFKKKTEISSLHNEARQSLVEYFEKCIEDKQTASLAGIEHAIRKAIPTEHHHLIDDFIDFANSEEFQIPVEFNVSKTKLSEYTRVVVKATRWFLSFDSAILSTSSGSDLTYSETDNTVTIRCNDDLKAKIKAILEERENK